MNLFDVARIYEGSNGEATKALYAKLVVIGPAGVIALNLFRAQKASTRAKVYRSRRSRDVAYEKKQWTLGLLCQALVEHAGALEIVWGWRIDPNQEFYPWVLYVELPTGQASFHMGARGIGPDFEGEWKPHPGSAESILRFTADVFTIKYHPLAAAFEK